MADLYYAVIALKQSEVDQVVEKINQPEPLPIGDWLAKGKSLFYGTRSEEWKPFNGKTIETIVNETKGYQSKTNLIDALDDELSDLSSVRKSIRVFFIDVFALYLDKYSKLAERMDSLVAGERECCVVISDALSNDEQRQLIRTYCKALSEVCREYRGGHLHRIVEREDDLRNFCNYLIRLHGSNRPSSAADQDKRLQSQTTELPRL